MNSIATGDEPGRSQRSRSRSEPGQTGSKYFLVSCPYSEKTRSGLNRLTAAPVFTLRGKTAGIVLQDCRDAVEDPEAAEVKVTAMFV